MRREVLGFVSVAAVSFGAIGCGSSNPEIHVTESEQKALPTQQLSAGGELCPDRTLSRPARLASKRRAHRHANALIRAFRKNPDALVRTTYSSSDEGPGTEDISVRELLEQWVRFSYCAPRVQGRLRAILESDKP